jgi:hypothetical protein
MNTTMTYHFVLECGHGKVLLKDSCIKPLILVEMVAVFHIDTLQDTQPKTHHINCAEQPLSGYF